MSAGRITPHLAAHGSRDSGLRDGEVALAWHEAASRITHRAAELISMGCVPGALWCWKAETDLSGILEMLAILDTGATLVPINPALTAPEVRRAIASLQPTNPSALGADDTPASSLPALLKRAGLTEINPSKIAAVIWTSGSSGNPRAVLIRWESLLANARLSKERLDLLPSDTWATTLSPAHIGGMALIIRAALLGASVECMSKFVPVDFLRRVATGHVTHASLVPTMLSRLIAESADPAQLTALRAVLIGGAAAGQPLLERAIAAGVPVVTTWGMSEMTSQVSTATVQQTRTDSSHSGRPLSETSVRVDQTGELFVSGPGLSAGRISFDPISLQASGECFPPDSEYTTGDLGLIDNDGFVRITGRTSDRIISGGVNVDPAEVEAALIDLDGVLEALVVGLPDPEWGEVVSALVVTSHQIEPSISRTDLIDRLRPVLTGAKLPRRVIDVSALPLTATGKVDRHAARELLLSRPGA